MVGRYTHSPVQFHPLNISGLTPLIPNEWDILSALTSESTGRRVPELKRAERVCARPPGPDHSPPGWGADRGYVSDTTSDPDSPMGPHWRNVVLDILALDDEAEPVQCAPTGSQS